MSHKILYPKNSQYVEVTGLKDQSVTPNTYVNAETGDIDYVRASWSRASWSSAADALRASWSRASWSCDCALAVTGEADPTRASWSRASWTRASWSRASWSSSFSK